MGGGDMNAELRETLELLATLDAIVTFSEHHMASPPVKSAAARVREYLIDCARRAIGEMANTWPAANPEDVKRWEQSLENGEVPRRFEFLPRLLDDELTKLEAQLAERKQKLSVV
jgi:hypothetical protein